MSVVTTIQGKQFEYKDILLYTLTEDSIILFLNDEEQMIKFCSTGNITDAPISKIPYSYDKLSEIITSMKQISNFEIDQNYDCVDVHYKDGTSISFHKSNINIVKENVNSQENVKNERKSIGVWYDVPESELEQVKPTTDNNDLSVISTNLVESSIQYPNIKSRTLKILKIEKYKDDINEINKKNINDILTGSFALLASTSAILLLNMPELVVIGAPVLLAEIPYFVNVFTRKSDKKELQEKKKNLEDEVGFYDAVIENPREINLDDVIESISNGSYETKSDLDVSPQRESLRTLKILKIEKYKNDLNNLENRNLSNLYMLGANSSIAIPGIVMPLLLAETINPILLVSTITMLGASTVSYIISMYNSLKEKINIKEKLKILKREVGNYELPQGDISYDNLIDSLGYYEEENGRSLR